MIKIVNKAQVLAALYNNAKVQGIGFLHADDKPMTENEAVSLLLSSDDKYFDYVKGRVMKIDLSGDEIDTRLYNRDNGEGAAERVIQGLTNGK